MAVSIDRGGLQRRPRNTINLILVTPKTAPLILENPHFENWYEIEVMTGLIAKDSGSFQSAAEAPKARTRDPKSKGRLGRMSLVVVSIGAKACNKLV